MRHWSSRFTRRLSLEPLEDRWALSAVNVFQQTNLVSDQPGVAQILDPNLINPWGLAGSPSGGTLWVSNNGTGTSSLFRGGFNGTPFIPNPGLPLVTGLGHPTGQVFNGTMDFVVHAPTGESGPAIFIFASEDGTITGWNPGVPAPPPSSRAQLAATVPGASFKGITIANNGTANFLYATDFHNGRVVVFDRMFTQVTVPGGFRDPGIPAGYAPFNIQNLGGKLYVTYAQQDEDAEDDVTGPGKGFVDVFDANGNLLQRLASRGPLNAPWGLALAPAGFGKFGGDVLVGNFGDGHVNAFDPATGRFVGALHGTDGRPIAIPGLWGLQFGNGVSVGDRTELFFASGPDDEEHGLLGSLRLADVDIIATGANGTVNVFDAATHAFKFALTPFGPGYHGDVRVAVGDVNGDGLPDVIAGNAERGQVRVFDGRTAQPLLPQLHGATLSPHQGVFVAAGDVNGDGFDDVIVGLDGGPPRVVVFSGQTGRPLRMLFPGAPNSPAGVRVAAGDVNGDGKADIIVSQGPGGTDQVQVFSGATFAPLGTVPATGALPGAGFFVAAGDVNGDGKDDIITSPGPGGTNKVQVFSGANFATVLGEVVAAPAGFGGGVRVATALVGGKIDIFTVLGPGGGPLVSVFDGATLQALGSFGGGDANNRGGFFIG